MCVVTTRALVDWYRTCARDLPWRSEPRDPYLVLVSEIMLQQTQVDRVAPRFASFVERFPTFADLAAATEDEVLTAWSGLGYYRRGRNLHRLAREVAAGAGYLPRMASDLERLPGIGPYSARDGDRSAFGRGQPPARDLGRRSDRGRAPGSGQRGADGAWRRGVQTRRSRLRRLPFRRSLRGEGRGATGSLPAAATSQGSGSAPVGRGVLCRSRGGMAVAADRRGSNSSRSVAAPAGGAGGSCGSR